MKRVFETSLILLPAAAVVLNALPNAVRMNWMGGYTTFCSGFSMLPVGYANWGPMMAGIGAIVLLVLGIIRAVTGNKRVTKWICGVSIFSCAARVFFGIFTGITGVGVMMCVTLAVNAGIAIRYLKYR